MGTRVEFTSAASTHPEVTVDDLAPGVEKEPSLSGTGTAAILEEEVAVVPCLDEGRSSGMGRSVLEPANFCCLLRRANLFFLLTWS